MTLSDVDEFQNIMKYKYKTIHANYHIPYLYFMLYLDIYVIYYILISTISITLTLYVARFTCLSIREINSLVFFM